MTDKPTIPPDFEAATQYRIRLEAVTAERDALRAERDDLAARVRALEAALMDIAYNANYNGLRHIWEMARAALKPTQSQTEVAPP